LAKEVAEKSMVLLKNETHILPLKNVKKIAVIGRLADQAVTGDGGSSNTQPDYVVSPLQGIKNQFGHNAQVIHDDANDPESAIKLAKGSDVVVLIVGYTHEDEGEYIPPDLFRDFIKYFPKADAEKDKRIYEKMFASGKDEDVSSFSVGGDRTDLSLRKKEIDLIKSIAEVNKNVVVSVIAGSTVMMEEWRNEVPAIIMQWYAGMEGGNALANILSGDVNPSGKLPFVIPTSESHLPYFDLEATSIEYDLWHGYRKLNRDGNNPAFPFGFGLSYTNYIYSDLKLNKTEYSPSDTLVAKLKLSNNGPVDGEEVVQLYISAKNSKVERAVKELKAFDKIFIKKGETREMEIKLPIVEIAYYDEMVGDFVVELTSYQVFVGAHELDENGLKAEFRVV